MAYVISVNLGVRRETEASEVGVTGIDKRPVLEPVFVQAPGPRDTGIGSGLTGDVVCDRRHHGGDVQAVYAYAREDLDWWSGELGRDLPGGCFGENLTTSGLDVTGALMGERWRVGDDLVLEVTDPRIPCGTFAAWMAEQGWVKTFTKVARPGAYLRVVSPGLVRAGDSIEVLDRPADGVTIGEAFRAVTLEPALLPRLLTGDGVTEGFRDKARRRLTR
ncbi:MOSC domain-containing protein YiiM [Hamadaea flava]|uniref:MOSC domain-containing protein n=1 Tax=Hamadaea flava TaxID=1742688 RepID=A0ABV8LTY0_9ACTN|nr:MOSC domain-containing protein [Hamadaea flava]MCP2327723.1 MOSC domain-containing protein YiiM [Hamadaea flava]